MVQSIAMGCCDDSLAILESTGKQTPKPGLTMVTLLPLNLNAGGEARLSTEH